MADEIEWSPDYLERVAETATLVGSDPVEYVKERARHRQCLLFLVTLLERWSVRGLTGAEIGRGLRASPEARRCIAGLLGARNAAVGGRRPWFRRDEAGRWHPTRSLRWEPWVSAWNRQQGGGAC